MTSFQQTLVVSEESPEPATTGGLPNVTVVVPTHNRPDLLRETLTSIFNQTYRGDIQVIVVFDRATPDQSLLAEYSYNKLTLMRNTRTPGLAGSRNTGILASETPLIAFCDDDDTWMPEKLTIQADTLISDEDAQFSTTAMLVNFQGKQIPRLAGKERIAFSDLLRSRMAMLHSSSFLIWRSALIEDIGLVDETLPRSMAEDTDLLLRAARQRHLTHIDRPLVTIRWDAGSYFANQLATKNEALITLIDRFPERLDEPIGAGMTYGKLAFREAAQGHRASAGRWTVKAFRANWREPRVYLTLGVISRVISARWVIRRLNRRGHGI